jgi:transglutaminase-like putative cysteine protease
MKKLNSNDYMRLFLTIIAIPILLCSSQLFADETTQAVPNSLESKKEQIAFTLGETKQYKVKHEVTITPSNSNTFSRIIVDLPLPSNSPHQKIDTNNTVVQIQPITNVPMKVTAKNQYFEVIRTKPFGSRIIHIELKKPLPAEKWVINLEYPLNASNIHFNTQEAQNVKFVELKKLDESFLPYLRPEILVECRSPEIKKAFNEIFPAGINEQTDSIYDAAQKIYYWELKYCSYQLNSQRGRKETLWGALDMLNTKKGECGDYSALFIALCRVAGIPARPQVGFWAKQTHKPHIWAEFYVPNIGWIPVDPSMGAITGKKEQYFGLIKNINNRVVVAESFDHMYGDRKIKFLQSFQFWYWYDKSPVDLNAKYTFMAE